MLRFAFRIEMKIFEFAEGVTMHGFNHVFVKGQPMYRTCLWSLAFVGSWILFIFQVSTFIRLESKVMVKCAPAITYWLSCPHTTNIEEVSATLLQFPSVTICNVNPILFSKVYYIPYIQ